MHSLSTIAAEVVGYYNRLDKDGGGTTRAIWCSFSSDFSKYRMHPAEVCHASMRCDPVGCDQVITAYRVLDEDLDLRWFDFMRFELYGAYKDHINLGKHEGQYYIHLTGLDKVPANVVYNLCITSRIIFEFRASLKAWDNLCELGVHPKFAFMLMQSGLRNLDQNMITHLYAKCTNTNHWPIDHEADLEVVMSTNYGQLNRSFASIPDVCMPCNVMWGSAKSLRLLVGKSIREFATQWKKDHPDHEDLLRSPR